MFQGLDISIENKKGSVRKWYDPHGKEKGRTVMHHSYGYIKKTEGTDGDHVDVYIGPDDQSQRVFIVNQMKKQDDGPWTKFDEQKVMLGFGSANEAKAAYLKQYDDPRFFGSMKELTMDDFKTKVLAKENHGKKIAMAVRKHAALMAEFNLLKMAVGEEVEVLGGAPEVKNLVATNYAETVTSPKEKQRADAELKTSGDRASNLADRIDDVGIATLAAPSAAYLTGSVMKRLPNQKIKAMGAALQHGVENLPKGVHHGLEAAGLAMVAPGITHRVAKAVTKEAMEKIAMRLYDDYEYKTEAEKVAIIGMLGRMAGRVAAIPRGAGALLAKGEQAAASAATGAKGTFQQNFLSAARGKAVSPAAMERLQRVQGKGILPGRGSVAPQPVAASAAPAAPPAARKGLGFRHLALGTGAAGLGLGTYGGYKAIQTASDLVSGQGEPMGVPSYAGPGRLF